jgi:glycosyltransferase involved in cell wall biosynthesis
MLRIAHTESSINMGGQEIRILEQIRWLLDHGHAAWLLAREDSAIYREGLKRGLPLRAVPFRGSLNPRAVLTVLDHVRREKIDLIDCHSSRDASTVLFAKLLGIPVVRSQHICKRIKDDFFHRLTWTMGCCHIIATSNSIAHRVVNQNLGPREIIDVIGEGVDLGRFRPDVDGKPARKGFGVPDTARLVTVIGMIRPDKAQRYLVRAVDRIVEQVPEAYFFVVGSPTKPEFMEELQQEIDRIDHKDRVILTGFQDAVEDFIAASDVIVLTSTIEARSQVIPQAFAMKKVVVATNVGGIPEYVKDGETGFLYPPGDSEKLAELVVAALTGDVRGITERAYTLAHETAGLDAMMNETLRSYRKVLGIREHT